MTGAGTNTRLTSTGWRASLAAAGMFLVGAFFFNLLILTFTGLLLLFLFIEAVVFHRSLGVAEECLSVKSEAQTITCTIGRTTEVQEVISNPSHRNFRITGLFLQRQVQSPDQRLSSEEFLLKKHEKHVLRSRFGCEVPGRFDLQALKVNLRSPMNLFTQAVRVPCKVTVIVRPIVNSSRLDLIDSSFLDDLTSDRIRRGAGTDLAGIKPSALAEDSHRVDWKATARTGKLMVKEFYLERQPPIMFLIDSSRTMKATGRGEPILNQLLARLPNLLISLRPDTPIGLTLYDEGSIVTNIPPRVGEHQRELILQALLNCTEPENTLESIPRVPEDIPVGGTMAAASTIRHQYSRPFNPRLHWFFRSVWARHREELGRQGAFRALTQIANLSESFLIIALTNGKADLTGLVQGARTAFTLGHRLTIILLTDYQKIPTSYTFPELRDIGVRMQECSPEKVTTIIEAEIARMSRERFIPQSNIAT